MVSLSVLIMVIVLLVVVVVLIGRQSPLYLSLGGHQSSLAAAAAVVVGRNAACGRNLAGLDCMMGSVVGTCNSMAIELLRRTTLD